MAGDRSGRMDVWEPTVSQVARHHPGALDIGPDKEFARQPASLTRLSETEPTIGPTALASWRSHVTTLPGKKEPNMYDQLTPLTPSSASAPSAGRRAGPCRTFAATPTHRRPATSRRPGLRPERRPGVGSLLASGGTYLAVNAAQRPATSPAGPRSATSRAPARGRPATLRRRHRQGRQPGGRHDRGRRDHRRPTRRPARPAPGTATGSGVIFDANGLILTNHHVVAGDPPDADGQPQGRALVRRARSTASTR